MVGCSLYTAMAACNQPKIQLVIFDSISKSHKRPKCMIMLHIRPSVKKIIAPVELQLLPVRFLMLHTYSTSDAKMDISPHIQIVDAELVCVGELSSCVCVNLLLFLARYVE